MATKKPLTFTIDEPPQKATAPSGKLNSDMAATERKQVGARIPEKLYRQLKARAALSGVLVQEMVEIAISEYLNHHAENAE
jgi:predicted HicB family RNase H-like nuclease